MIKLSVFFSLLGSLQFFDMIVSLTGGGPLNTTHTMVSFLYYFGIGRMRVGFGSAVGRHPLHALRDRGLRLQAAVDAR